MAESKAQVIDALDQELDWLERTPGVPVEVWTFLRDGVRGIRAQYERPQSASTDALNAALASISSSPATDTADTYKRLLVAAVEEMDKEGVSNAALGRLAAVAQGLSVPVAFRHAFGD